MRQMNVQFTEPTAEALEQAAEKLGTSKAGVLRFGVSLVEYLIREQEAGNALGVIRGERVVKELASPWRVRQTA